MPITINTLIRQALHLVYPNACLCCHELLMENESVICNRCYEGFDHFALPGESQSHIMDTLKKNFSGDSSIDLAISCYKFHKKSHLSLVIHAVKYEGFQVLALDLGARLGRQIRKEMPQTNFSVIIPIPLHPVKKIERTYNQAELLASGASDCLAIEMDTTVLHRIKHTNSQTSYVASERKENLQSAFYCNQRLDEQSVLLVDDVFTTGATMISAAKVLKKAGALNVTVATLAVADS